jgi:hypothetical protein
MTVFSSLNWWIGCCIFFFFFMNPTRFHCHSLKLCGWCTDVAFDPLVSAAKGETKPHFSFFSSHPRFYRSWSLPLLWLLGILSQRRENICTIFVFWFFWGSLHCFWCTWTCYAVSVSQSCVLFTLCIMSLNFHWSKKWYELFTSCNVFCMQAWHFRNFQIRAIYALLAIIASEHPQQLIWKKPATLAHCRVLFIAARMFTKHCENFITTSLNKWWISTYFFLPFIPVVE